MALYDASGTADGAATLDGSMGIFASLGGTLDGGSGVGAPGTLDHVIVDPIVGSSSLTSSTQGVFNMTGFVAGSGGIVFALQEATGVIAGGSALAGNALVILGAIGYLEGGSVMALSVPEPIVGVANLTAYMEVICVWPPVCQTCTISASFRWGHVFTQGDLDICLTDLNGNPWEPGCINYTLYQVQRGCALKQVGPSGRRPVRTAAGCYYATGTAGECGQPGLWAIVWHYQRTFSDPVVEQVCYFTVMDAVLCPIFGDTLERACKYGWD